MLLTLNYVCYDFYLQTIFQMFVNISRLWHSTRWLGYYGGKIWYLAFSFFFYSYRCYYLVHSSTSLFHAVLTPSTDVMYVITAIGLIIAVFGHHGDHVNIICWDMFFMILRYSLFVFQVAFNFISCWGLSVDLSSVIWDQLRRS